MGMHDLQEKIIAEKDARIDALNAGLDRYKADAECMNWIADNAELVTTGQGMRIVIELDVFGNNNWSIRDYLSMQISGKLHETPRNDA